MEGYQMEKPENISDEVWEKHLDWFNVTGQETRRHIRELKQQRQQKADRAESPEVRTGPPTSPPRRSSRE